MTARSPDPRRVAFEVLTETEAGAYADRAAGAALAALPARDRSLARQLGYGCVRLRGRLDAELAQLVDRPLRRLDPAVLNWLRIGLYQLREMRTPDHAAVHEAVEGARRVAGPGGAKLVNAVLRRAARESVPFPTFEADPAAYLTSYGSHPQWLIDRWLRRWPRAEVRRLVELDNAPPAVTVRLLEHEPAEAARLLEATGLELSPLPPWPRSAILGAGAPAALLRRLSAVVQDPAASAVVDFVGPHIEAPVLDSCAAPGGKAIALAAAAREARPFVAADTSVERLARLADSPRRAELGIALAVMDGRQPALTVAETVLLDVPCSGTGVFRRRPDARWRLTPRRLASLVNLQRQLLDACVRIVPPGGLLVYATCSLEPEENEEQIDAFVDRHRDFCREPAPPASGLPAAAITPAGDLEIRPWQWATDGAFAARLRRKDAR